MQSDLYVLQFCCNSCCNKLVMSVHACARISAELADCSAIASAFI